MSQLAPKYLKKKHHNRSQLLNAIEQLKPQQKPEEVRDDEPNG
jgi:hypothetical protein